MISSYNNGMQQILDFNPLSLSGYNATQVTQLANTWTANNITVAKSQEIKSRISKTNEGLESLLNYMNSLSINNV